MNEIGFDESKVKKELYEERLSDVGHDSHDFPMIYWDGGHLPHFKGSWIIKQNDIVFNPRTTWSSWTRTVASYPFYTTEKILFAYRLRCVVLGVRRRVIIDDQCQDSFHEGAELHHLLTAHTQVMITIKELDDPVVIDLRGLVRSACWSSKYASGVHPRRLLIGVEERLRQNCRDIGSEYAVEIPWLCSMWIDLVPLKEWNDYLFVEVLNHDRLMAFNPFTVSLSQSDSDSSGRIVDMEDFERFQKVRREVAIPWEDEWNYGISTPQILSPLTDAYWAAALRDELTDRGRLVSIEDETPLDNAQSDQGPEPEREDVPF